MATVDFFNSRDLITLLRTEGMGPVGLARAFGRVSGLFWVTSVMYVDLMTRLKLDGGKTPALGSKRMRLWCDRLNRLFGVKITVTGKVPPAASMGEKGILIMSNHRSYADITVVGAHVPAVFIARGDFTTWPILGPGAALAGHIFVDRGNKDSRKKVAPQVRDRLEKGVHVLNFPEGLTYGGEGMSKFNPGLFVAFAGQDVTIVPVVARYAAGLDWAGRERKTFILHILQQAGAREMVADVHFCDPIQAKDYPDPDALLEKVRQTMLEAYTRPAVW